MPGAEASGEGGLSVSFGNKLRDSHRKMFYSLHVTILIASNYVDTSTQTYD